MAHLPRQWMNSRKLLGIFLDDIMKSQCYLKDITITMIFIIYIYIYIIIYQLYIYIYHYGCYLSTLTLSHPHPHHSTPTKTTTEELEFCDIQGPRPFRDQSPLASDGFELRHLGAGCPESGNDGPQGMCIIHHYP